MVRWWTRSMIGCAGFSKASACLFAFEHDAEGCVVGKGAGDVEDFRLYGFEADGEDVVEGDGLEAAFCWVGVAEPGEAFFLGSVIP